MVLSHDGNLKRCFGVDKKINECDWDYLETLETVREPRQKMPRLEDLLGFLSEGEEGREAVWVLLDIKVSRFSFSFFFFVFFFFARRPLQ